ncbi:MAG: 6-phosphogluconolactonase, partial [Pseudohongiellaceae bacterium]
MAWVMHSFADNETLVTALAREIATMLREAIDARGRAAIAVSGGSTPRTLFDALAGIDLPWSQVVVTLVDERWV